MTNSAFLELLQVCGYLFVACLLFTKIIALPDAVKLRTLVDFESTFFYEHLNLGRFRLLDICVIVTLFEHIAASNFHFHILHQCSMY